MTAQTQPWPGFKYVQVPGLANRFISRWLRTQRKNMRRFFADRGLYELADRMDQIRKSRQGMMAKNRMFQKVLDDYAKLSNPTPVAVPTAEDPVSEATDPQTEGDADVGVPAGQPDRPVPAGAGDDAGGGVQTLEAGDVAGDTGTVIEE